MGNINKLTKRLYIVWSDLNDKKQNPPYKIIEIGIVNDDYGLLLRVMTGTNLHEIPFKWSIGIGSTYKKAIENYGKIEDNITLF